jgi:8-oxo-dGTP pyrophosphatase MutT (NUDIX family)
VLLFRFLHKEGALVGQDFWATTGGGVEEGETFEQAAIRELGEETGIRTENVGPN